MLERRTTAVAALLLLTLCGCTGWSSEPEESASRTTSTRSTPGRELPSGVPLVPGAITLLQSELVGEYSHYPQGRWQIRVLPHRPVAHPTGSLAAAEKELTDAGYRLLGRSTALSPVPELWMTHAGTTVLVRSSARLPRLLEYTVTRSFRECERSYCDGAAD